MECLFSQDFKVSRQDKARERAEHGLRAERRFSPDIHFWGFTLSTV